MARKKLEGENEMKITKEQINKFRRAARRQAELDKGAFIKGGPHKGTKKDQDDDLPNTLSTVEIKELTESDDHDPEDYDECYEEINYYPTSQDYE